MTCRSLLAEISLIELALRYEMLQLAAFRYQPGRQSNRYRVIGNVVEDSAE